MRQQAMGRVFLLSAFILVSLRSCYANSAFILTSHCSVDDDCSQRYEVTNAVCTNVSTTYSFFGNENSGYRMECRCGTSSVCRAKEVVCQDVSIKEESFGYTVLGMKPSCRCPSDSLFFPLGQSPYCLRQGYTDWFQHSVPELGYVSEVIEMSPAISESVVMTWLSVMKDGSKLCDWMSCGNRAAMCSDASVFKKLIAEPKANKINMTDLQTLVCKVLSTNLTQLYMDLTRDTRMVKDLVMMTMNMDTITHDELETIADNMKSFVTHAVAFFSDPKPFEEKFGLVLPKSEAFGNIFNREIEEEFSLVILQGLANLDNNRLQEWLTSLGKCDQMREFVSKAHDSLRHAIFIMNKIIEFTSSEDIIGTLKKFPQTKKLLDMMDKLPHIVAGFGELVLGNPQQMQDMLDKVLDVLLSDSKGICSDTSFLEGYVVIEGGTTVKNILDLFCHDLVYGALWRELGLHKVMDDIKIWFMKPSYTYAVRFDPPKFVEDVKELIKLFTPLGRIGSKRYRDPEWISGRFWEKPLEKVMSYANRWTNIAMLPQNIKTYLDYLRLPIPNTLTAEQNIGFLSLHDVVILINELLKGLGGSMDYLSTVFSNTVEMKKIVHLLVYDLPTIFEKTVGVLLDHVKLAKFTKALQDQDACDKSTTLYGVIGDNPLTQLVCEIDTVKLEEELASLADNNKMVKALYQLVFQKYDGQSFNESAFIDELRQSVDDLPASVMALIGTITSPTSSNKPWFNSTVWSHVIMRVNLVATASCKGTDHVLDCVFRYIKATLPVLRWKMLNNITSAISAASREVDTFMVGSVLQPLDDMIQGIRKPCAKPDCSTLKLHYKATTNEWLLRNHTIPQLTDHVRVTRGVPFIQVTYSSLELDQTEFPSFKNITEWVKLSDYMRRMTLDGNEKMVAGHMDGSRSLGDCATDGITYSCGNLTQCVLAKPHVFYTELVVVFMDISVSFDANLLDEESFHYVQTCSSIRHSLLEMVVAANLNLWIDTNCKLTKRSNRLIRVTYGGRFNELGEPAIKAALSSMALPIKLGDFHVHNISYEPVSNIESCSSGDSQCLNDGKCVDHVLSYECQCHRGFAGKKCELFVGPRGNLYRVNTVEEKSFSSSHWLDVAKLRYVGGFKMFDKTHFSIQVKLDGLIGLSNHIGDGRPRKFNTLRKTFLAPFWRKQSLDSSASVSYLEIVRASGNSDYNREILATASRDVRINFDFTSFSANWVLIVTWKNMKDGSCSYSCQRYTYQAVLVTDGLLSFVLYNYDEMVRKGSLGRVFAGYRDYTSGTILEAPTYSGTPAMYYISDMEGNFKNSFGTAVNGKWIYRLDNSAEDSENDRSKCLTWAENTEEVKLPWFRDCPPTVDRIRPWQYIAITDETERTSVSQCFFFRFLVRRHYGYSCCYNDFGALVTRPPNAGFASRYNKFWRGSKKNYVKDDLEPFKWCCGNKHIETCRLFHKKRPIMDGSRFLPPRFGFGRGDPHICSLDGPCYTFNGLGQYDLIVETGESGFQLQGRTERVGNAVATLFTAIAAKETVSDAVHIELASDGNGVDVYVNNVKQSGLFENKEFTGVAVTKTATSAIAGFNSDFVVTVQAKSGMLTYSIETPVSAKTSGLMGNMNKDTSDDFSYRNGTLISPNSTEREKFYMGQSWMVSGPGNFLYKPGESPLSFNNASFLPLFIDELSITDEMKVACGSNVECLFDYAATGEKSIALTTKHIAEEDERLKEESNQVPPVVTGTTYLNATIGMKVTFRLSASDSNGDSITLQAVDLPNDLDFSSVTGAKQVDVTVEWTPSAYKSSSLIFSATDSTNRTSSAHVIAVSLSPSCKNDATPDFIPNEQLAVSSNVSIILTTCRCVTGWEGDDCSKDIDGCADSPCASLGTNCTDVPPSLEKILGVAFQCRPCPDGFTESFKGDCVDLNECRGWDKCQHECLNKEDGQGYECACRTGYRLDGLYNCTEFGKCERDAPCSQICTNFIDSYMCSCYPGYYLDFDRTTCIHSGGTNACKDKGLICSHFCKENATSGESSCGCPVGYNLSDSENCTDINECKNGVSHCQQPHHCVNTEGGHKCGCDDGYSLASDERTCTPCDALHWGWNCSNTCDCGTRALTCNATVGCTNCRAGWTGVGCSDDVDECKKLPSVCAPDEYCVNTNGSYSCLCESGFVRASGKCVDRNECATGDDTCDMNAECTNTPGSFDCTCNQGYQGNGFNCSDVDECKTSSLCHANATCVNTEGSFKCQCNAGLSGDGVNDCFGIDECAFKTANCSSNAICTDLPILYSCSCKVGYSGDGTTCIDIKECSPGSGKCHRNATCRNTGSGFSCECNTGFLGDGINCTPEQVSTTQQTTTSEESTTLQQHVTTEQPATTQETITSEQQATTYPTVTAEQPSVSQQLSTPKALITTTEAKTARVNASVKLGLTFRDIYKDWSNLETKQLVKDIERGLTLLYQRTIKNLKEVIVTNLRSGSVVVDHQVVLNTAVLPTNEEQALRRNITRAVAENGQVTVGSLKVSAQPTAVSCASLGEYCRNKGKCTDVGGSVNCSCPAGVTGAICQYVERRPTQEEVAIITGSVIGGLVFIVIVVSLSICFWYRRRRERERKNKLAHQNASFREAYLKPQSAHGKRPKGGQSDRASDISMHRTGVYQPSTMQSFVPGGYYAVEDYTTVIHVDGRSSRGSRTSSIHNKNPQFPMGQRHSLAPSTGSRNTAVFSRHSQQ